MQIVYFFVIEYGLTGATGNGDDGGVVPSLHLSPTNPRVSSHLRFNYRPVTSQKSSVPRKGLTIVHMYTQTHTHSYTVGARVDRGLSLFCKTISRGFYEAQRKIRAVRHTNKQRGMMKQGDQRDTPLLFAL